MRKRNRKSKPVAERLWPRVNRTTSDECWQWTGAVDTHGYGVISGEPTDGRRRNLRAHRVAYESTHGPIPSGLIVIHGCDNPACCNPNHLRLGTIRDNSQDMVAKGRHGNQKKTHCVNGHALAGDNLRLATRPAAPPYRTCWTCYRASQAAWYRRKQQR